MASNWFDPNAFMKYGGRLLKGFRGNINDVLGYAKDTADAYRLGKIFNPDAIMEMNRKAMDIAKQNARAKVNQFQEQLAQRQAQEDIAQAGRARAVGTKGTYPKAVKMSSLNKVNPKAVEQALGTPGKVNPSALSRLATPEQLTELSNLETKISDAVKEIFKPAPKVSAMSKAIKLSPWLTPIIGGIGSTWETGRNWNKPGSNAGSRTSDASGILGAVGGPMAGLLIGGPAGAIGGAIAGLGSALYAHGQAKKNREANMDYESGYLNNPEMVRKNLYDGLLGEAKQYGYTGDEAKKFADERIDDYVKIYFGQKEGLLNKEKQPENTPTNEWPFQKLNPGSYKIQDLPNITDVMRQEMNGANPQGSTARDNTSLGINTLGNNLMGLNGATNRSEIVNPVELLYYLLGGGNGNQQISQQPQSNILRDNRDFTQRVYDRADELRQMEQGGVEIPPIEQMDYTPEPTVNDIMLQRLAEIGQLANQQQQYKQFDPIQRMWIAKAGGMTPYQVWGDYPNQNTRLKTLYEMLGKEYKIRKDMEDRDRQRQAGEAISQTFVNDPATQGLLNYGILSGADVDKLADITGIKDANKLPFEMKKKEYDRHTDMIKNTQTGMNTAYNTQLMNDMIADRIPLQAQADIIKNRDKASTPDINKMLDLQTSIDIANSKNALDADKATLNAQVRYTLGQMAQSNNAQLRALAQVIASGTATPEQTQAFTAYMMGNLGIGNGNLNGVNVNGVGSLFAE